MRPFTYIQVAEANQAIENSRAADGAVFLAGGTNLIDEMKLDVQTPTRLIDINALPLNEIQPLPAGGLRIGAMVRNSDLAWDNRVREQFPVLSEAILSGASPQLRNLATTGGNLLQHTRCYYFRDTASPCNMRQPGSGCSAIGGYNRIHAVLGASEKCIATHPSDMCVAMAALNALIYTVAADGERAIPINEFYVPYGDDPARLNVLKKGELITHVELPPTPWAIRSHYLKVRDRASYEFALASAAVALHLDGQTIREARLALGGVATRPWRASSAEKMLAGQKVSNELFRAAAEETMKDAQPREFNEFKIELAKRTIVKALHDTAALS